LGTEYSGIAAATPTPEFIAERSPMRQFVGPTKRIGAQGGVMKVLITGGTGFLGSQLAKRILALGSLTGRSGKQEPIDEMVLFDVALPATPIPGLEDKRIKIKAGDIADKKTVAALIDRDDISVFHLASIVSGHGEKDFDLAMRVNLDGHLHLLEALRARPGKPHIVFASSAAVFGGPGMPKSVGDTTKQLPQTTYGMTKAMGEMLINEYTRKGFVDGRSARLPTVIVRPGKPNAAASSAFSGVIREPLAGVDFEMPIPAEAQHPMACYRTVVECFVKLHELEGEAIGADRTVSLPALNLTVAQLIESLKRVAGNRHLGAITFKEDPFVMKIVRGWPSQASAERALQLGLPKDAGVDSIIKAYIEDFAPAPA
jgi:nucleoside-diphosphate-sugar epimerase